MLNLTDFMFFSCLDRGKLCGCTEVWSFISWGYIGHLWKVNWVKRYSNYFKENVLKKNKHICNYFVQFTDRVQTGYKSLVPDVINFSHDKNIKYPIPKNTMFMCIIRYRVFSFIMRKLYNVRWLWYICIYFVLFADIFLN